MPPMPTMSRGGDTWSEFWVLQGVSARTGFKLATSPLSVDPGDVKNMDILRTGTVNSIGCCRRSFTSNKYSDRSLNKARRSPSLTKNALSPASILSFVSRARPERQAETPCTSAKQQRLARRGPGSSWVTLLTARPHPSCLLLSKTHKICPQSALNKPFRQEGKAQPWACPDTGLLAMGGFHISTSSAQPQPSSPSSPGRRTTGD
ncbi:uncharacterized protein B0T15DRAFT_196794 [Chaetomium strumarium]|uniref:Uncharacterized protein n=1 Tax=Chaetomium strumarium TaxID=1170767 RepID=A0AAJ0GT63_9PEZI|nr:hypothetical protein B0T15DRAFT_196794 [Chaetomium strumarium]